MIRLENVNKVYKQGSRALKDIDESFSEMVLRKIDEAGMKECHINGL